MPPTATKLSQPPANMSAQNALSIYTNAPSALFTYASEEPAPSPKATTIPASRTHKEAASIPPAAAPMAPPAAVFASALSLQETTRIVSAVVTGMVKIKPEQSTVTASNMPKLLPPFDAIHESGGGAEGHTVEASMVKPTPGTKSVFKISKVETSAAAVSSVSVVAPEPVKSSSVIVAVSSSAPPGQQSSVVSVVVPSSSTSPSTTLSTSISQETLNTDTDTDLPIIPTDAPPTITTSASLTTCLLPTSTGPYVDPLSPDGALYSSKQISSEFAHRAVALGLGLTIPFGLFTGWALLRLIDGAPVFRRRRRPAV
ncbi:hypothetical protein EJ06DRAFT_256775 [Trichodelitschia bisporula]|uniref:Uncharacterized protein n=1 Tax=Trichodelitschia bisporula TaxID=703511 RepID=A0A6G1HIP3_9PEZI|nr:hypothetical protein EJ06DRAFT_256775 [Trichodelitschia bisporula]